MVLIGGTFLVMRKRRSSIRRISRFGADERLIVKLSVFLLASVTAALKQQRVSPAPVEDDRFYDLVVNKFERFVDKTGLIEEFLEEPSDVIRIVRPNGWGKTTNLYMLKRFFEVEEDGYGNSLPAHRQVNRKLFYGGEFGYGRHVKTLRPLNISRSVFPERRATLHQGQYPVILLDFDELIGTGYEDIERKLRAVLANLFRKYRYLIEKRTFSLLRLFRDRYELRLGRGDGNVEERDRSYFKRFEQSAFTEESDFEPLRLEYGLKLLSKLLFNRYGRSVFVLIDNYDAPLNRLLLRLVERYRADYADADAFSRAVTSREFRRAISLFQAVYNECFKTNPWLQKGVLTGIVDVYFPKLNDGFDNTYSLLDSRYGTWYGLSDAEVDGLFVGAAVNVTSEDRLALRNWCSYYRDEFGAAVYRTSSVQRYIEYGANEGAEKKTPNESRGTIFSVSDVGSASADRNDVENETDATVADALLASDMMQETLYELLIDGKSVSEHVERKIEYDFITSVSTDFSIALYGGYLKAVPDRSVRSTFRLSIVNEQTRTVIEDKIVEWTCRRFKVTPHFFRSLSELLINGEISEFENSLRVLLAALPSADRTTVDRHLYYDGLIRSLAFALRDLYSVRFDDRWCAKQSGRSDLVLTSKQGSFEKQMIIIGYESVPDEDDGRLDEMVLRQLERLDGVAKNITGVYYECNVTDMLKFAVVFRGKDFRLGYRL